MSKTDLYQTLGVAKNASADDLKKAYRKLAMQYHPDRNPGDAAAEHKFKEANLAYEILKDEQKRAAYDRYGHAAFENGGMGGARGHADFGGFSDLFDEIFGAATGRGRGNASGGQSRGSDLRYNLDITLEDAFHGKQATIRFPSTVGCETCDGSGARPGTSSKTCGTCMGHGRVRAQQGFFTIERTCPACNGVGTIIEDPCIDCNGHGAVRKDRTLDVTIPAGVEDGTRIRLSGEGEAGLRGAGNGDLYIFLTVTPHKLFEREGADLLCRVPISMAKAALGGTVEIPGIDGVRTEVKVDEGTQTGKRLRLRGKGMPVLRAASRGDLYVEVVVETPVHLSKKQKELLQQFADSCNEKTSPQASGFFDKVKELWQDLTE